MIFRETRTPNDDDAGPPSGCNRPKKFYRNQWRWWLARSVGGFGVNETTLGGVGVLLNSDNLRRFSELKRNENFCLI